MAKVKCKLLYDHSIGDRVELYGAMWERDGEYHYANIDKQIADQLVAQGNAEVVKVTEE